MNRNDFAIIMAGGIGSRIWPIRKKNTPKQFLDILGTGETLIQQTFRRLKKIVPVENIFIVTNEMYKQLCLDQINCLKKDNILLEPVMRNTAPCIAYASFKLQKINPNANMIIAASDHIITNEEKYINISKKCLDISREKNVLLTLGINPSRPDTGYGYIQYESNELEIDANLKKVKTFTEKPNQELALSFIDSGDFLWNSGMFIWSAKSITLAFRKYLRDIYDIFEEGKEFYQTKNEQEYINRVFPGCKNISIDYAIMEKADNVYVFPSEFGWSDLGTWGSVSTHIATDKDNNSVIGNNIIFNDSVNNIVNTDKKKLVVLQGLDGYIIIDTKEVLMICKTDDEQKIKDIVNGLKRKGLTDYL
ncbi:MAG: mannose-1-phosphate guanylyltransferase [Flavobacteriales bacterium]|nr:mannose-1-phosphate guanylyltransferase [Flavobacteriales bacterium]